MDQHLQYQSQPTETILLLPIRWFGSVGPFRDCWSSHQLFMLDFFFTSFEWLVASPLPLHNFYLILIRLLEQSSSEAGETWPLNFAYKVWKRFLVGLFYLPFWQLISLRFALMFSFCYMIFQMSAFRVCSSYKLCMILLFIHPRHMPSSS
jgi:hypothetical protein